MARLTWSAVADKPLAREGTKTRLEVVTLGQLLGELRNGNVAAVDRDLEVVGKLAA